ncbi:MAG TPA: hypothetical protein VHE78_09060 [Gemmatimonadaceae bacterium]|nr:hypothetical protein [Gemmatimonadaceae bacterium]
MRTVVPYIPIATTLLAFIFAAVLFDRWRTRRRSPHLVWWGVGMLTYAAGTITESATTLFGWHESLFRAWYITGALLGGAPLAQGSVYLHLNRRTANILAVALVTTIVVASTCVVLSPIDYSQVEGHRLTGKVLIWSWVRMFSPFINLYALVFLAGSAALSAWRFARRADTWHRFVGNTYIAVGALLPGIGGAFTRFGHTEVLYVTEFIGLLMIFIGYRYATLGRLGAQRSAALAA